jgi:Protein of unknown function (DUF1569)
MKSLWNEADRRELDARIGRLTPDRVPLWGRMSAPQMVAHLAAAIRMATGELPIPLRRTPFRHPVVKQLLIYFVPMPKSLPTARELQRDPAAWDADVADLRQMLERFAARDRKAPWPAHPAFGPLGAHAWGVLTQRHLDHHLRQFGV